MNKRFIFSSILAILVLLGAYYVIASITGVTTDSPATGFNTTNTSTVTFQCTATETGATYVRNISLGFNFTDLGVGNGSIIINTTQNLSNGTNTSVFTIANLPEGRFLWGCLGANFSAVGVVFNQSFRDVVQDNNASLTKLGSVNISTNRTVIVDGTGPSNISLIFPIGVERTQENENLTNLTNAHFTNGSITVVWTINDSYMTRSVCNVTVNGIVRVRNVEGNSTSQGAGSSLANFSTSVTGFTSLITTNTWFVNCTDHVGNANSSNTSGNVVFSDTVIPYEVGPLTFKGTVDNRADVEAVKFDYGSKVTITGCNGTENVDYFTSNATIDIKLPGSASFSRMKNDTSGISSFVFDDTNDLGTYEVNCTYIDGSGNLNSTTKKFEIVRVHLNRNMIRPEEFRQPISAGSRRDFGEISSDGVRTRVSESGAFLFQINGEPHEVLIDEIKDDQITVVVKSDPITAVVKVGEAKSFDVDKDGTNDIEVKLDTITSSGRADITFTRVSTPAPLAEVPPVPPTGQPRPFVETVKEEAGALLTILVIIFVVLLVIYLFLRVKKGGSSKVAFSKRDLGAYRDTTLQLYYK